MIGYFYYHKFLEPLFSLIRVKESENHYFKFYFFKKNTFKDGFKKIVYGFLKNHLRIFKFFNFFFVLKKYILRWFFEKSS